MMEQNSNGEEEEEEREIVYDDDGNPTQVNLYFNGAGPSKSSSVNSSGLWDSFVSGLGGGLQSTLNHIKNQFTLEGYVQTLANTATGGAFTSPNDAIAALDFIQQIPDYSLEDWFYAGGFLTEKAIEFWILKRAGNRRGIAIPTNCFVAGTLILTCDGLRPIEEIDIGDLVWALPSILILTPLF